MEKIHMNNTISKLHEKVTLQTGNKEISGTTVSASKDVVDTRASIRPVCHTEGLLELFEIIALKPPPGFKHTPISSIKWNNTEYVCHSPFKEHDSKFLKGVIAKKSER
jgi:hypothetical protein